MIIHDDKPQTGGMPSNEAIKPHVCIYTEAKDDFNLLVNPTFWFSSHEGRYHHLLLLDAELQFFGASCVNRFGLAICYRSTFADAATENPHPSTRSVN